MISCRARKVANEGPVTQFTWFWIPSNIQVIFQHIQVMIKNTSRNMVAVFHADNLYK